MKTLDMIVAGSGGCFRKGALVQLENGKTIAIEQLKAGDEILAFDEQGELHKARVTTLHYHDDPQPILHVRFWRGDIFITPNHWVLNQYGSFVEMGTLTAEDALVDGMGHLRPIISMGVVAHEPVYNLTVEPFHTFICDGVRVHNGGHRERFPVVAGSGGGGKGKGGKQRAAVEAADSLFSQAKVRVLDLLGEGEIGGLVNGAQSIFLDDTPIAGVDGEKNFTDVEWEIETGRPDQKHIKGFEEVGTPYTVSVQVKQNMPRIITINNPNVDRVKIVVSVPSLMHQNTTNGDISGTTINYKLLMSKDGGPFEDEEKAPVLTISGKTRSTFQREHVIDLDKTAKTWSIKLVRVTADSTSSSLNNDLYFDSYTEIVDSKLSYANSAIVGVVIDSRQFSRIPSRSYLINGLKIRVPRGYTPPQKSGATWIKATYPEIWDGTFQTMVSSNPAWIMFDLLTNSRYGLGSHISDEQIDVAMLYRIGIYCDELVSDGFGGSEPRFMVNTVIQTRAEAYRVIADLASAFRGMAFWSGGMVGFMQDAPREPSMSYTPANVIDGIFQYTGSARKDRHSVALVTWNDPEDNYRQKIEYVEDADLVARHGIRQTEMVAFGCTTRGQAYRAGLSLLYTERFETDLITFKVGLDSALVLPGEIVKIHDTTRSGKRMGGRIVSCTETEAVLDAPVTLTNTGAVISLRLPDNSFVERKIIEGAGEHEKLTWREPLETLALANSIWILSDEKVEPMLARVVSIRQESATEFEISALQHNPSKYDAIEKGLKLEEPKTSMVNTNEVADPTNFVAFESTYQVSPRILGSKIHLSWTGNGIMYEVRWRRTGDEPSNWTLINTVSPGCEIENVQKARYEFELRAFSISGRSSRVAYLSHTVTGKTAAPGEVTNFRVNKRISDLLLTWDPVTDIDLMGYEVREGISWDSARIVQSQFMGTSCVDDKVDAGTYYYHIRSVDNYGNYSEHATTYVLELNRPRSVQMFNCIQFDNRIDFRWRANPENDIVGYQIREGKSWALGTLVTEVMATTYSMPSGSVTTDRTFWIKAIASPGIESAVAAFSIVSATTQVNRNVIVEVDEGAGSWSGFRYNISTLGDDLVLEREKKYGEYLFNIDLPTTYTARNSLMSNFDAVSLDEETWASAGYSWNSVHAGRPWIYSGDLGSVSFEFLIARHTGLIDEIVESFPLDGSTIGERGTRAGRADGVAYRPGRFRQGAYVTEETDLRWAVNFPEAINLTFWVLPEAVDGDRVLWTGFISAEHRLVCGMDEATRSIYLEDTNGRRLSVPVWPENKEPFFVGLSLTHARRILHAGLLNHDPHSAMVNLATPGSLIMMALNDVGPFNHHLGNIFYDGQYTYGAVQ